MPALDRTLSIAPMMGWTDRHGRFVLRSAAPAGTILYTEMITANAILRGDRRRLLDFAPGDSPLALQVAGIDPVLLSEAARIGEGFGYDEINLNAGCPSCAAGASGFGAHMMLDPDLILRCMGAIRSAVSIPVTLKCRLGVDDQDPRRLLPGLLGGLGRLGCDAVIIHARKALLQGVSPRANRAVPPLDHGLVHDLARDLSGDLGSCGVVLNGGISSLEEARVHLPHVSGVMIGRAAVRDPLILSREVSRADLIARFAEYAAGEIGAGAKPSLVMRMGFGLVRGLPGARRMRQHMNRIMMRELPFDARRFIDEACAA